MASCDLEDMYGTMEVTLFPRSMEEHGHKLEDDLVVVFEGRLDRRDDEPNLICYGVEPIDPASANGVATLRLNLGPAVCLLSASTPSSRSSPAIRASLR